MWGNSDLFHRILSGTVASDLYAGTPSEMSKMRDAEEEAKNKGVANCVYCEMEIWYHPKMGPAGWTWESEDLVGWCNGSKTSKHQPKLRELKKEG